MAIYHCRVKPAKAAPTAHSKYIEREGQYAEISAERGEDVIRGHGNLPDWAENDPSRFWQAQEAHEAVNANPYREIEIALPKELESKDMERMVQDFTKEQLGDKHAYEYALHLNEKNPHAHVMFSEKINDGIQRSEEQYFKRYNTKNPERGGCLKDQGWKPRGHVPSERLLEARKSWEVHCNRALECAQVQERVDHRSLEAQGVDRAPQIHVGYRDPARPEIHAERLARNEAIKTANNVPELKQQAQAAAKELREASRSLRAAKRARAMAQQQKAERPLQKSPEMAPGRIEPEKAPTVRETLQPRPEVQQRPQEAQGRQGPSESAVKNVEDRFKRAEHAATLDDRGQALQNAVNKARSYVNAEKAYGQHKAQVDKMTGVDKRFGLQDLKELGGKRDLAREAWKSAARETGEKFGKDQVKNVVEKALGPHAQIAIRAAELARNISQSMDRGR